MTDPCKSCICKSCRLSAVNGNIYGCKEKRCKACNESGTYTRLSYCTTVIDAEQQEGEIIRI